MMTKDIEKFFGGDSSTGSDAVTKEDFLEFLNSPSFEEIAKQEKDKDNDIIDIKEKKSLEEIIQEIADEEGMTYEETMKLFKQGLRDSLGASKKKSKEQVKKDKKKRKQVKASRKKNRK